MEDRQNLLGCFQLMASPPAGLGQHGIVQLTAQQGGYQVVVAHPGSVHHTQVSAGPFGGQPTMEESLLVEGGEWSKKCLPGILGSSQVNTRVMVVSETTTFFCLGQRNSRSICGVLR